MSIIGNSLILPSGGGGGGSNGNWMGNNPTLMTGTGWSYSETIYLKDTSYPTWTPSTTATTILAGGSTPIFEIPVTISGNYNYVIFCKTDVNVAHSSGATLKNTVSRWIRVDYHELYTSISKYQNFIDDEPNTASYGSGYEMQLFYYNSSGTPTITTSTYGPAYFSYPPSVTINTQSGIATFKIYRTAIQARCQSTYFSTARAAEVDANNTTIKLNYMVYRIDARTGSRGNMNQEICNILNNPL